MDMLRETLQEYEDWILQQVRNGINWNTSTQTNASQLSVLVKKLTGILLGISTVFPSQP